MFAQLHLTETVDQVVDQLGQRQPDLLVLDLNGYNYLNELAGIGTLIRSRAGAPVLVLCPFDHTSWLPELMTFGHFDYRICPLIDDELRQAVVQALVQPVDAAAALQQQLLDKEKELRDVLGVQRSLQRALASIEPVETMAAHICLALCNFPGVRHGTAAHERAR
jgi:DNA-binding NtrC family response regulator